jgi:small subunit ribosomal protein S3
MGQKVSPTGFRVGLKIRTGVGKYRMVEDWRSHWFANKKDFAKNLVEDQKIKRSIKKEYFAAGIPRIEIDRRSDEITVRIFAARPGLLIGRKGAKVEKLKTDIEALIGREIQSPQIIQIENPEIEAQLVAEDVALQLEKRASFRRVMKKALEMCMQAGAQGAKIMLGGRLGGSELARREHAAVGKIPLQTIRAKIDYGTAEAATTYGRIGVKCWIYKGEIKSDEERMKDGADAKAGQPPKAPAR